MANIGASVSASQPHSHEGEHSGDVLSGRRSRIPISWRTQMMALLATGNSFMLGYDVGISSLVSQDVSTYFNLKDSERGVFVGSLHFFMIVGALASPSVNDRFGRRACFCAASTIQIIGLIILVSAESYTQLLVGRSIAGIGAGAGLGVSKKSDSFCSFLL